ncbi:ABC transporter [Anopheles sinensis]|uniref:ABC transporter n=1 Tax=Anopheles sinensis TaxID=74873 RepID=A0A084WF79_ANOSI|nr:ABC transporter [Anopheles sinensis]
MWVLSRQSSEKGEDLWPSPGLNADDADRSLKTDKRLRRAHVTGEKRIAEQRLRARAAKDAPAELQVSVTSVVPTSRVDSGLRTPEDGQQRNFSSPM